MLGKVVYSEFLDKTPRNSEQVFVPVYVYSPEKRKEQQKWHWVPGVLSVSHINICSIFLKEHIKKSTAKLNDISRE